MRETDMKALPVEFSNTRLSFCKTFKLKLWARKCWCVNAYLDLFWIFNFLKLSKIDDHVNTWFKCNKSDFKSLYMYKSYSQTWRFEELKMGAFWTWLHRRPKTCVIDKVGYAIYLMRPNCFYFVHGLAGIKSISVVCCRAAVRLTCRKVNSYSVSKCKAFPWLHACMPLVFVLYSSNAKLLSEQDCTIYARGMLQDRGLF